MVNLDYLCMKYGGRIAECEGKKTDKENLITKALGVLQENGPYAMFLYLESQKGEKGVVNKCKTEILMLFREEKLLANSLGVTKSVPENNAEFKDIIEWLRDVSSDLDCLLFFKQICQQVMLYARYHVKALEEETEEEK